MSLRSALPGDFNQLNTAVAALVLAACGVADDDIVRAVLTEPHVPGRMERVRADAAGADDAPLAVVDFAHTADAVAAALAALRRQTRGSLVAVLGAGGDRDSGKRRAMGAAAASCADVVLVTDDNPRSEDPAAIRAEVLAGARSVTTGTATDVREVGDRAAAIRAAIALAGPADTVAVLGKGHESGQEVHGTVHPFDDREELLAALTARTTHKESLA
jgi:UDP-N-acetylmuramoyl-L-alanyl-D-glutamate--2,6-diaminopimelate ligase